MEILRTKPEVLRAAREEVQYLLVDEYQDSNPVQVHAGLVAYEDPWMLLVQAALILLTRKIDSLCHGQGTFSACTCRRSGSPMHICAHDQGQDTKCSIQYQ